VMKDKATRGVIEAYLEGWNGVRQAAIDEINHLKQFGDAPLPEVQQYIQTRKDGLLIIEARIKDLERTLNQLKGS
jgi:hypothetical protein